MRYELDSNGYICKIFFGCLSGACNEYTGTVPTGYETLEEWAENANIRAYKIVDGNLTHDADRDAELQAEWQAEWEKYRPPTIEDLDLAIENSEKATQDKIDLLEDEVVGNYVTKDEAQVIENKADAAQSTAETAQTTANTAQTTANNASTAASQAQDTANSANTTAQNAEKTANSASETATNAQATANTANETATEAKNTADSASETATNAQTKADEAKSTANTAQNTANTANENATKAQNTANSANSTANEAKETATNAQSTASTANENANKAQTAAEQAQSTADTANQTATEAQSTANSASTTANEAKSTANTANENASKAQNTANEAKSTAEGAETTANNANTTAGEAKSEAEQANTKAGNAETVANQANTTATNADTKADEAKTTAGEAKSTADSASATATEATATATTAQNTADQALEGLDTKVGNDEVISKINNSTEETTITPNKYKLEGKTTANGGFGIDEEGNATLNNATITGGRLDLTCSGDENPKFRVYDEDYDDIYAYMSSNSLEIAAFNGYALTSVKPTGGVMYMGITPDGADEAETQFEVELAQTTNEEGTPRWAAETLKTINKYSGNTQSIELKADGSSGETKTTLVGDDGTAELSSRSLKFDITPHGIYTWEEVDAVSEYLYNGGTLTDEQKEMYDLNKNGEVDEEDWVTMYFWNMFSEKITPTAPGSLEINSRHPMYSIAIKDKDGYALTGIGLNGIYTNHLNVAGGTVRTETVLFEDNEGDYQSVSLSDSAANYSYIEIYYKNDDGQYGYQKVYDPNGKTTFGTVIRKNVGDTNMMINSALFYISEEVITITRNSQANIYYSSKNNSDNNKIYITKVVGYK